jgi:hypothetical protein
VTRSSDLPRRRPDILGTVPFYPPLIGGCFAIATFVDTTAAAEALPRALAFSVLLSATFQIAASGLIRNRYGGAAVAGLAVLALIVPTAALVILVLLTGFLILRIRQGRRLGDLSIQNWTKPLNAVAALTLGLVTASALFAGALTLNGGPGASYRAQPGPDIYVLLFDAYPRADTLQTDFHWDNSGFVGRMTELGFANAADSHANYNATVLTLATLFGMAHVDQLVDHPPASPTAQFRLMSKLMNHGIGLDILRGHGYEIVTLPSAVTNVTLYSADRIIDNGGVTDLELSLLQVGLLPELASQVQRSWLSGSLRERTMATFASLSEVAAERVDHPRFVFAHFMSPHPPTLVARDGSNQEPWPCFPQACSAFYGGQEYGDAIVEPTVSQIEWLNGRIERVAADILANSVRPPVIIVFSDHGHRHDFSDRSEMLRSMFMAYTPNKSGLFPADTTPINTLPRLLNAYLGEDLPLVSEQSYVLDMAAVPTTGILKLEPWSP